MKNKMEDLRNHMFAELERLGDENLKGEALDAEIRRAKAIREVAGGLIDSAKVEISFLEAIGATTSNSSLLPAPERHTALPHKPNGAG